MMRALAPAFALASTLLFLAACDDAARVESSAARARDSSLAHDLQVAGGDSAVSRPPSTTVTESPGRLDAPLPPRAGAPASNASLASASSVAPSAEGYVGPSCASPALDDQRRCLLGYLARSDLQLDRSYQALIDHLKAEAGTRSGSAEPAAVQRLRSAQRAWLVYRDDECRKRTIDSEGPLWAPVRARCLAEYSALRTRELGDALAKRPAVASQAKAQPRSKGVTSKRTSARKSSRSRNGRSR